MNLRRTFNLAFALILVLSLLPSLAIAAPQPQAPGIEKIEKELLDLFSVKGSGDFVVRFAEQADLSPAYQMGWGERGQFVVDALKATAARAQVTAKALLDKQGLRYQTFIAGNELYVYAGDLNAATSLAALPEVAAVRATVTMYVDPILNADPAPEATTDWGIIDTKADLFWAEFGLKGEGIVVANIDTGVQWDHPALVNQFKCTSPTDPTCWSDPSNICGGSMCDNNGHGTHTMGTMVSKDDPSLTYIAGMAPNAEWIACKGCESSSCSEAALNGCADWILAPGGSPANRPHVVNNSWGGGGGDAWYQAKVQAWQAAGIFPAFSAGNSTGCGSLGSPGDYQESFGTTGHNSTRAHVYAQGPSATFGHTPYTKPNITAPASSVCSTVPTNSWSCGYSGTSMASPHSAGAVALLWSCNPSLIGNLPASFEALQDSADAPDPVNPNCGVPPDGEGTYEDGYGYLNVLEMGIQNCVSGLGAINGHVRDAVTMSAVDGAIVTGARQGGGQWSDDTDATGYYSMTVGVGTYDVAAEHPLYTTGQVSGLAVPTDTVVTQDFYLQPRGHLYGYVTDADSGAPLAATVTADGESTATDPATGYYELYLDAGSYDVTAEAPDYAGQTVTINIAAGQQLQQNFQLLAAVAVVPEPIHATVQLGQYGSLSGQLINNMAAPYPFEFFEIPSGAAGALGTGGPDPFGYSYKDNAEPDGPMYDWIEISTTGTPVQLTDDDWDGPFSIGFDFSFYGTVQTQFYIGSNGFLSFGSGSTSLTNQCPLPSSTTPNNLIALMWDDLDPGDTSDVVYYQSFAACPYGAGSCLVVQYDDFCHYPGGATCAIAGTWEAILFDNGNVLLQYEDAGAETGSGSTTGIENSGGTIGLGYGACNTSGHLSDGLSICYQYPGAPPCFGGDIPWFGTSIVSGTVPANGSLGWTNVFSATAGAGIIQPGDYEGTLMVQPGTAGHPRKMVPVIMTVLPTPTQGQLVGTVTSDRPGGPLEAEVNIQGAGGFSVTLTTDPATGDYGLFLEAGTYDVTASAAGYVPETRTTTVVATQVTDEDFELDLLQPEISVSPLAMQQTLSWGNSAVQTLYITNDGLADLHYQIQEVDLGGPFTARTVPAALVAVPVVDTATPSIGRDPNAPTLPAGTTIALPGLNPGSPAYGISLGNDSLYRWPDIDVPSVWTLIGATAIGSAYAGEFRGADFDTLYVIDDDVKNLYAVNTATGVKSLIGPCPAIGTQIWAGMAWDPTTDIMYGSSTDGATATLWRINLATGTPTQVGTIAGMPYTIDIAIDGAGQMYGHDIQNDQMIRIDKATGATTVIGPTGIAANYAQGMDYDLENDILYLAGYVGTGNIYIANTTTGAATLVGAIPGGVELDAFAIQAGGAMDVPWLSQVPVTGTVPAGQTAQVQIHFDSMGVQEPGTYRAQMIVQHDDPLNDPVAVQVTMTVQPSSDVGRLEGIVTSDRPGGPLEAEIVIDAGGGVTYTATTDPATGFYYRWLAAGLYDVTARADGYVPETVAVQITGLQTTTQDFQLELIAPEIVVTPGSLHKTLVMGQSGTDLLNIANDGIQALDFQIFEIPQSGPGALGIGGPDPFGYIYKDNAEPDGPQYQWIEISGTGTPVLLADDNYLGPFPIGFDFSFYDTVQTQFYIASNGYVSFGTGSSTLTNQCPLPSATTPNNLIAMLWDDLDPGDTGDPVYYQTFPACPYGVGACLVVQYEDFCHYPGGASCAIAGTWEAILFDNGNVLIQYEDAGAETGSGSTTGIENSGGTIGLGYGACDTAGSLSDNLSICYQYPGSPPCFAADVPWLATNPVSGTVPAGGDLDVTVSFDASAVPEPNEYYAMLFIPHNDPLNPPVRVPVTLTVLPSGDIGKLEGTVAGLGYCDDEWYPLEAELEIEAEDGTVYDATANGTGYYYAWLAPGNYTVTATYTEHVDGVAGVTIATGVTITQDFELRYVESCMDVTPTSFSLTLPVDTQFVDTLSLINDGAGELAWELRETTATLRLVNEDVLVRVPAVGARPGAASRSGAQAQPAREFTVHIGYLSPEVVNVLIVTPDVVGGGDISLLLGTLAAFPDLNVTVWDGSAGTPSVADMLAYDVVFVGNDILWSSSTIDKTTLSNNLADLIDAGGKVIAGSFIWSYDDWGFGGGRFITNDYSPFEMASTDIWDPTNLGAYDAGHPIMAGINTITDGFNHQDPALSSTGTWVASWADGENFVAVSPNVVGLNQEYFQGAVFGGQVGELLHNAFLYLTTPEFQWGDVPWVSENPTSGIVPPDSTTDVDVTFDTTGLTIGECYTASLGLLHDDPGWETPFFIPLTLCVAEACDAITAVELSVSTLPPIYPGDPVEISADLLPDGATPPFSYMVDGGPVQTTIDDPFTFTVTFDAPGLHTVEVAAWNCAMAEPVTATVDVLVAEPEPDRFYIYLPLVSKNWAPAR